MKSFNVIRSLNKARAFQSGAAPFFKKKKHVTFSAEVGLMVLTPKHRIKKFQQHGSVLNLPCGFVWQLCILLNFLC